MKHAAVRRIVLSKRQDGEAVFEVLDGPKAVEYDSASGKGLQVQLVSPAKLRDHLDVDGFHFVPGRSHTHTHTRTSQPFFEAHTLFALFFSAGSRVLFPVIVARSYLSAILRDLYMVELGDRFLWYGEVAQLTTAGAVVRPENSERSDVDTQSILLNAFELGNAIAIPPGESSESLAKVKTHIEQCLNLLPGDLVVHCPSGVFDASKLRERLSSLPSLEAKREAIRDEFEVGTVDTTTWEERNLASLRATINFGGSRLAQTVSALNLVVLHTGFSLTLPQVPQQPESLADPIGRTALVHALSAVSDWQTRAATQVADDTKLASYPSKSDLEALQLSTIVVDSIAYSIICLVPGGVLAARARPFAPPGKTMAQSWRSLTFISNEKIAEIRATSASRKRKRSSLTSLQDLAIELSLLRSLEPKLLYCVVAGMYHLLDGYDLMYCNEADAKSAVWLVMHAATACSRQSASTSSTAPAATNGVIGSAPPAKRQRLSPVQQPALPSEQVSVLQLPAARRKPASPPHRSMLPQPLEPPIDGPQAMLYS